MVFGRSLIYLFDERQLNGFFLLSGIRLRVIFLLNSPISTGATRYGKICSKIEKLVEKLPAACGQA